VALPLALLLSKKVRQSPALLLASAFLVVAGVALNRINVFLVSYHPPYSVRSYVPAMGEIAITVALAAT